jgi:lambda family phage portal protein
LARVFPALAARRAEQQNRLHRAEIHERLLGEFSKATFGHRGGYEGASSERPLSKWNPGGGSADDDILDDLPKLRERSRDLIRNDPHAEGMVGAWVENIVGTGLVPQAMIDRDAVELTEDQAEEFTRAAEKAFARWAKRCDTTRMLSFGELQELVIRQHFENGECFVLPRPDPANKPFSLRVQVIESDRVDTPIDKVSDPLLRMGIKIGELGERLGYWIKKTHPGDIGRLGSGWKTNDFVFVPHEDEAGLQQVFHLYKVRRADQSRGTPLLAPALLVYKQLQQYVKAELISAKIAACYALWIVTPDPLNSAALGATKDPKGTLTRSIEPGSINYLSPGESLAEANPNRPNSQYDTFVKRMLRSVGSTIGMPYEQVSSDYSQTNYSSGRMALTEVRKIYRKYQQWLATKLLQPLYERVLLEAFLLGEIPAVRDFEERFADYAQVRWVGPGWNWVDPAKEVDATVKSIDSVLSTLAEECAQRGLNWEDVLQQRAREQKRMKELGIEIPKPAAAGPPGAAKKADEGDDKDEKGAGDGEAKKQSA